MLRSRRTGETIEPVADPVAEPVAGRRMFHRVDLEFRSQPQTVAVKIFDQETAA